MNGWNKWQKEGRWKLRNKTGECGFEFRVMGILKSVKAAEDVEVPEER